MLAKKSMGKINRSLLLFLIMLGACQDNDDFPIKKQQNSFVSPSVEIRNQIGLTVAKNLALSLSNSHVKDFLKRKTLEKFDGDYNFLIPVEKDGEVIPGNSKIPKMTFGEVIAGGVKYSTQSSRVDASGLLDSIKHFFPLLQVKIPQIDGVRVADWDPEAETPLVAYVPATISNGIIPAFDVYGKYHELPADKVPTSLTIVISENERIIALKKDEHIKNGANFRGDECPINQDPYFQDDENLYYNSISYYDELNLCTGGYGGGSSSGSSADETASCDRDIKTGKDRLNKLIFSSNAAFKKVNDWFDGGQEIEVTVFFALANGAIAKITKIFYGKDHDFRDCGIFSCTPEWFGLGNAEIVTWDKSLYGDAMLYYWTEKDPGEPLKISTSFSVTHELSDATKATMDVSVSKTITNHDDLLGESIVEYCDNTDGEGYSYVTGAITFLVRQ